ncbi:hypothetical protein KIPB_011297, partial [Kipferlia bialata]
YVLDSKGGHGEKGSAVQLYSKHGNPNQVWLFDGNAVVGTAGGGRVLDIAGNKKGTGASLIVWDRHDGANQRWTVEYV